MVNAVKIPVSAKMRLGWDDENLTAPGSRPRGSKTQAPPPLPFMDVPAQQGFSGFREVSPGIRAVVAGRAARACDRQWRHHHAANGKDDVRQTRLARRSASDAAHSTIRGFLPSASHQDFLSTGELPPDPRLRGARRRDETPSGFDGRNLSAKRQGCLGCSWARSRYNTREPSAQRRNSTSSLCD